MMRMDLHYSDRVALITGAASGIGRAVAKAVIDEGGLVALLDRDADAVEQLARDLGESALAVVADVTNEHAVIRAIRTTVELFGGIHSVVGCAGISGPFGRGIQDISLDEWNAVMAVNVTGQFLVAKHSISHLAAAESSSIVMIASDSSFVAAPGMVPYNASKGAVLQLTRALSVDLAEHGIRVNCICPSIVDTPMSRADLGAVDGFAGLDFPVQTTDEVARHVLYLTSPASRPINGHALVSDFGYLARSSFPA